VRDVWRNSINALEIYDEEKLILILRRMGFNSVFISSYQEGIDPDDSVRQRYSFYIEAVK
jgi:hypothetical protein